MGAAAAAGLVQACECKRAGGPAPLLGMIGGACPSAGRSWSIEAPGAQLSTHPPTHPPLGRAQDQARIAGALAVLRFLARKYEFRDEEERGPLDQVVNTTFPTLLQIFQVGGGAAAQPRAPGGRPQICRGPARLLPRGGARPAGARWCTAPPPLLLPAFQAGAAPRGAGGGFQPPGRRPASRRSCNCGSMPRPSARLPACRSLPADAAGHGLDSPRAGRAAQAGVQDLLVGGALAPCRLSGRQAGGSRHGVWRQGRVSDGVRDGVWVHPPAPGWHDRPPSRTYPLALTASAWVPPLCPPEQVCHLHVHPAPAQPGAAVHRLDGLLSHADDEAAAAGGCCQRRRAPRASRRGRGRPVCLQPRGGLAPPAPLHRVFGVPAAALRMVRAAAASMMRSKLQGGGMILGAHTPSRLAAEALSRLYLRAPTAAAEPS